MVLFNYTNKKKEVSRLFTKGLVLGHFQNYGIIEHTTEFGQGMRTCEALNGMTRTATSRSANASDTMNELATRRSRS